MGAEEPPVPVEALIESLFIPVRYVSLPLFFTAATVYEDGLPVMVVNWAQPEHARRRAMAHMLGHILLVLHGDEGAYPRDSGPHEEADMLATELMMPAQMVVEQSKLWFNDQRYIARLFGVEEEQMLDRMRNLQLIKGPKGVVWDY